MIRHPNLAVGEDLWSSLAFGLLVLATFVIPWQNLLFFQGIGTIGRFVVSASFAVAVLAILARGRIRVPRRIHLLIAGFVLWSVLSILWSIEAQTTAMRIPTMVQAGILVWLVWEFARTRERQGLLLQTYVLGTYVTLIGTFISYVVGSRVNLAVARYSAEGFNPNYAGMLFALGIPIAWYLSFGDKRGYLVWVNRLYVPTAIVGILLTGTRTAYVSALVSLVFILVTAPRLGLKEKLLTGFGAGAGLLGLALFVPAYSFERATTISGELASGDLNDRVYIWQAALETATEYPVLGVGAGMFQEAAATSLFSVVGRSYTAHNSFLSVLVELGPIGFALFTLIVIFLFFLALQGTKLDRWFWTTLLVVWLVSANLGTREFSEVTWLLFGLLISFAAAFKRAHLGGKVPLNDNRR